MIHDLKTWPVYFQRIIDGSKTFEIRFNDRCYQSGDIVNLHEWNPETNQYTGNIASAKIGFVTAYEQENGHVVFSLLDVQS